MAAQDLDTLRQIGGIIRQQRQDKGLTLAQVSEETGLSISYLSQVERGLVAPSISSLKKISNVLGIQAAAVMFGKYSKSDNQRVAVVRKGYRKKISFPTSEIEYELLTPNLQGRSSVLFLTAPPNASSGEPFSHHGQDCVIVLEGKLTVEVDGIAYVVEAGDSITFDSELKHSWQNNGEETVKAIWVSTPPSF